MMWTIERQVADGWELIEDNYGRLIAWNDQGRAVERLERMRKAHSGLRYRIVVVRKDFEDFEVLD